MKFNELNKEQADQLYTLLLNHKDEWISQEYICLSLPEHFKAIIGNSGGTDICRDIWVAVQYINYNLDYGKIVVIKNRKYKLANEKEAQEFYKKQRIDGLKKLYRAGFVKNKIKRVGQISLFNKQDPFEFIDELVIEELFETLISTAKAD